MRLHEVLEACVEYVAIEGILGEWSWVRFSLAPNLSRRLSTIRLLLPFFQYSLSLNSLYLYYPSNRHDSAPSHPCIALQLMFGKGLVAY